MTLFFVHNHGSADSSNNPTMSQDTVRILCGTFFDYLIYEFVPGNQGNQMRKITKQKNLLISVKLLPPSLHMVQYGKPSLAPIWPQRRRAGSS